MHVSRLWSPSDHAYALLTVKQTNCNCVQRTIPACASQHVSVLVSLCCWYDHKFAALLHCQLLRAGRAGRAVGHWMCCLFSCKTLKGKLTMARMTDRKRYRPSGREGKDSALRASRTRAWEDFWGAKLDRSNSQKYQVLFLTAAYWLNCKNNSKTKPRTQQTDEQDEKDEATTGDSPKGFWEGICNNTDKKLCLF